jgi:D-arabinose 1-dehydrogenase-like Zn-dependent alcohol dehydrogenase
MKAAVVHDFAKPLSIEDVPVPEPKQRQVLVRIAASGLCHTDIHAAHGDWPVKPDLPLIPGHEGVGIVEALGPDAEDEVQEGDRVAIPWLGYACGHCRYCNAGWETLCEEQSNTGYSFVGLPADNYVQLPIFETVLNGITIKGSIVGTHHDVEDVFKLHQLGRTRVLYETRPLEDVNEAFEEVEQARTKAPRVVLQPQL